MAKIGRNEKCPCRSGKKYKHCCARKPQRAAAPQMSPEQALKVTLMGAVKEIQHDAANRKNVCRELGVFFFYATGEGDAWLMEMTACDCVKISENAKDLEPPIDENSETIEINWSHTYSIVDKKVSLTAYEDKSVTELLRAPSKELAAAMKRIRKKFSQEQLDKVHLPGPE